MKKLVASAFKILPETLKGKIYRELISISYTLPEDFSISVATSEEDYLDAFALVYDSYLKMAYTEEDPVKLRANLHHASPNTSIIVLKHREKVIGTASIYSKSNKELPIEELCEIPDQVKKSEYGEISSLTIEESYRSMRGQLLFPMVKYLVNYCEGTLKQNFLLATVNPKALDFYQYLLLAQPLKSKVIDCPHANGAPAANIFLNLDSHKLEMYRIYGTKVPSKNFYTYLYDFEHPNLKFPKLYYYNRTPALNSPSFMKRIFDEKVKLFEKLSIQGLQKISEEYTDSEYDEVFSEHNPQIAQLRNRKSIRFYVNCPIKICKIANHFDSIADAMVVNASKGGLRLRFKKAPQLSLCDKLTVRVRVSDFDIATLELETVAKISELDFGLKITKSSREWLDFLGTLENTPSEVMAIAS